MVFYYCTPKKLTLQQCDLRNIDFLPGPFRPLDGDRNLPVVLERTLNPNENTQPSVQRSSINSIHSYYAININKINFAVMTLLRIA